MNGLEGSEEMEVKPACSSWNWMWVVSEALRTSMLLSGWVKMEGGWKLDEPVTRATHRRYSSSTWGERLISTKKPKRERWIM